MHDQNENLLDGTLPSIPDEPAPEAGSLPDPLAASATDNEPVRDLTPNASTLEPALSAGTNRGGLLVRLGVIAAIAVLLIAGVSVLRPGEQAAGAASPEGAVAAFLGSVGDEDILGAAELMTPGERRTLVRPGIEIIAELKRLGILADDFDLGSIDGFDVTFSDMQYTPTELAADVVRVDLAGSVTSTTTAGQLPLGPLITENFPTDGLDDLGQAVDSQTEVLDDTYLVAVNDGGTWYVSMWYTVAESIRMDAGQNVPDFSAGVIPVGGATPEEAVQFFIEQFVDLDIEGTIAALDPDETAALYDYASLFLDDAQRSIDELRTSANYDVQLDRLDLAAAIDGDDATVAITGLGVRATFDDVELRIDSDGDCAVWMADDYDRNGSCVATGDEAARGIDLEATLSLRVRKVDGRWFVSPTSSVLQPLLQGLRSLEREQLQRWINDPFAMLDEAGGVFGESLSGLAFFGLDGDRSFTSSDDELYRESDDRFGADNSAANSRWVFVIDGPIVAGTPAEGVANLFLPTLVPNHVVPDDALTGLAVLEGRVAVTDIEPGRILVADMFAFEDRDDTGSDEPRDAVAEPTPEPGSNAEPEPSTASQDEPGSATKPEPGTEPGTAPGEKPTDRPSASEEPPKFVLGPLGSSD